MIEEPAKYFFENATKLISVSSAIVISIAVTFDVGFFYGIGIDMFTFFTLSEHVLFSIQWLPVSLVMFFVVILIILSIWLQTLPMRLTKNSIVIKNRAVFLVISVAVIFIFILSIYITIRNKDFIILIISAVFVTICTFVAQVVVSTKISYLTKGTVFSTSVYLMMLGSAFGIGYGSGWLRSHENNMFAHTIITKHGDERSGRIIRAGDKGVLFLSKPNNEKSFLKWEDLGEVIVRSTGQ